MWFDSQAPIVLENARLFDPVEGETRGALRLARGRIAGINAGPKRGDVRLDLDGAWVLPGFINAHDHLELDTFPRLKFRDCYANARDWAHQVNARLESDPAITSARAVPLADRLFIGGLKNLLAGATTVAHHNPLHPPLRRDFPVRVVARYGWSHSLYLSPDWRASYRRTPRSAPWMIHLAEGTDADAQRELAQLDAAGCLHDNTVLIHGVGLSENDRARLITQRAALVWCPSSNFFLLDATANVRVLADANRLALGSDSRLTGERDLLDELRVAHATGQVAQAALLRAVTSDAARILRLDRVGRLTAGMYADVVVLDGRWNTPLDALGQLRRADLRAVFVGGTPRVADPDLAQLFPNGVSCMLDGRRKLMARDFAMRLALCAISEPGLALDG